MLKNTVIVYDSVVIFFGLAGGQYTVNEVNSTLELIDAISTYNSKSEFGQYFPVTAIIYL